MDDKTLHDLKNALLTLEIFSESLEKGYSFDDEHADEKRKVLIKSISVIISYLKKKT